jgi:hypothetical protein
MWQKLLKLCHDSEIILFARVQVVLGVTIGVVDAALPVLLHTDLSPFISDPKTLAAIGIVNGVGTELLRKYRATDLDK